MTVTGAEKSSTDVKRGGGGAKVQNTKTCCRIPLIQQKGSVVDSCYEIWESKGLGGREGRPVI
jgi:hypothetical protein